MRRRRPCGLRNQFSASAPPPLPPSPFPRGYTGWVGGGGRGVRGPCRARRQRGPKEVQHSGHGTRDGGGDGWGALRSPGDACATRRDPEQGLGSCGARTQPCADNSTVSLLETVVETRSACPSLVSPRLAPMAALAGCRLRLTGSRLSHRGNSERLLPRTPVSGLSRDVFSSPLCY